MGMLGQWIKKMNMASRLDTVQNKHNLMIPEQRSLNLFTRNPPRNVPPPPADGCRSDTFPPDVSRCSSGNAQGVGVLIGNDPI
uniref:Uncharacterized protein n=1 Tax=Taeniopygia guttata TaxID=59729 RepID=A0A674HDX9_TAEGU